MGCQTPPVEEETGNLVEFLVDQIVAYGGRLGSDRPQLPPIIAPWTYDVQRSRCVVQIQGDRFTEVAAILGYLFGPTRAPIGAQPDGGRRGVYAIGDIGVAIVFTGNRQSCRVVIVNPRF